jgi:D-alanyl-D-alanine dipeptidase
MSRVVLLTDERVTGLPVIECGEILCDLREVTAIRLDPRRADPRGAFAHVRAGILDRLIAAQTLLPPGLRLLIVEGYRPVALQRRNFEQYCAQLSTYHPQWSVDEVHHRASRYVAPPDFAPHLTGAAVDLTVCDAEGSELPMGTEINAGPEESDKACYTASNISAPHRANRELLARALTSVGLVNYPAEWWHWSYGDRYWAYVTGRTHARYGPVELPAED